MAKRYYKSTLPAKQINSVRILRSDEKAFYRRQIRSVEKQITQAKQRINSVPSTLRYIIKQEISSFENQIKQYNKFI